MKVLFVSGYDLNGTNANVLCFRNVIEKIDKYNDIIIDVLGNSIFNEKSKKSWKTDPLTFVKRIIHWPAVDPNAIKKCKKLLLNYNLSEYDYIVVSHKPYESVLAILKLKHKFLNAQIYLYELDPMTNEIDKKNGLGRYLFFLSIFKEKKMYKKVDRIFHMESNRSKYTTQKYKTYFKKFSYLDIPLLNFEATKAKTKTQRSYNEVKFIYTGILNRVYRNPEYTLLLLNQLDNYDVKTKFIFNFFSKGDCEDIISKYCDNKSFVQHGYVDNDILNMYFNDADFLINIGNHYSNMLPSKLLTYISKGKPIIHFSSKKDDPCLPYLDKYGPALIIQEYESLEKNLIKLFDFVHQNIGKCVNYNDILEKFVKNTAEWSAKQIISQMRKDYVNGDKK